jgi:hypothetical protein
MSQLKGNTVYMVLYNYYDCDYSIVIIMEKIEDAYNYICHQETNYPNKPELFKMITISRPEEINEHVVNESVIICYISSGNYNKFDLCGYVNISNYVIVPMVIC